nr:glycosyltransferase [Acidobacteriota bacterium]
MLSNIPTLETRTLKMQTLETTPKQRTSRKTAAAAAESAGGHTYANGTRPWSVMHATEHVRGVIELAEAQRDLGMHPVLVTPQGHGSIELYLRTPPLEEGGVSLLSIWQEVRQWRKSLADCAGAAAMEIVHAHCFAAGMSGVRNWPVVVYDLRDCVEHDADPSQQWLARSLRVAEQFVLTRAQAVVVHRPSRRATARERGTAEEHIFVVPDPIAGLEYANGGSASGEYANGDWLRGEYANGALPHGAVTFFAPGLHLNDVHTADLDFDLVLSAFAQVLSEVENPGMENPGVQNIVLLLEGDPAAAALRDKLAAAGISRAVRLVTPQQRARALHSADVVLTATALTEANNAPNPAGLEAMRAGRAVLAADTTANRDLSPEG